ncbi:LysR substrate-binding domain-containing protein [uncultured Ruegeria sp.]|uniref:LysR substrate-binding domain-containing protein n=1 Tax=uncultured Ruegeria sp. TaxID=259304 RepID=UPI002623505A|nr:LysR substrate-binding domain-containing protein [uncultured Ruegeria sp.]
MKRGVLPLNALRAFESTARLGRMRDAADELGVTYGAISRQIRGLEKTLGIVLFDGPKNKLEPTEAALRLLPALTYGFDRIEEAVNKAMQEEDRIIDVSCLGTLSMRWLIPRLYDFHDKFPKIDIRLTTDDGPVNFAKQHFDVAIRVGSPDRAEHSYERLFDDAVGPVLSPKIVPNAGILHPNDMKDIPLLHTKTRKDAWANWCETVDADLPHEGREYEHFYFMLEAATAGLGAALAPQILVTDDIDADRLVAPFGFQKTGNFYYAAFRPRSGPQIAAFIEWLVTQAQSVDS